LIFGNVFFIRDKKQSLPAKIESVSVEIHDVDLVALIFFLVLLSLDIFKHKRDVASFGDEIVASRIVH